MSDEDPLARYREMRSFDATPEPDGTAGPDDGGGAGPDERGDAPRYVIQKHAARALHYDVRLEAGGVLVSWAVPKGPSLDPAVKRLAVHVEDHPIDYRTFEGIIPGAQYGAGRVIVWDEGTYRSLTDGPVTDAVAAGHLSVWLDGTKLQGGWSLTRTGRAGSGGKEQWLMVKRADDHADPDTDITATAPASAVTGRTLAELDEPAPAAEKAEEAAQAASFVEPMLASLGEAGARARTEAPEGWTYERKLDGLRCIAVLSGGRAGLWSRNQLSFDRRFPSIVHGIEALGVEDAVLDGEIVAFDGEKTSFSGLQAHHEGARLAYVVFDLLYLLGRDITHLPLAARRDLLGRLLADPPPPLALMAWVGGDERELVGRACADGWEGLIAKRTIAPYRGGRSRDWLKLVCMASQELIIVGWTEPRRSRTGFGALLLGYYDDDGTLRYAGKVGTGFDEKLLRSLRASLDGLAVDQPTVADKVPDRVVRWVRPELVAAVDFKEWTPDGRLRHPSFKGLRDDKDPRDVHRDRPPAGDQR